jgi:uncharacterized membrane protein YqiK
MGTTAVEVIRPIESALDTLKRRAEAIVVRNQEEYILACQIALDGRAYIKDVKFKLGPGIESAKTHLDFLKNEQAKYVEPANLIIETAAKKAEAWKAEERRKAEAEQARINEERRREAARIAEEERLAAVKKAEADRKAKEAEIEAQRASGELKAREAAKLAKLAQQQAEEAKKQAEEAAKLAATQVQEVKVAAAVPKVAGIKARVNWKFRIVDATRIPREYLMPDEVKIGQKVRELKQAGAVIPGVEAFSEDGI